MKRGYYDNKGYEIVEIAGLYWHFVDIVWIVIFTVVYLTFISGKATPNKYIYIVVLCVVILLIDVFINKLRKKKK